MLVIVIVNWNVRDLLRACLQSIERFPATLHSQAIVVVDNASTDGSVEMLRTSFQQVHVVASVTNRGFSGGNNDGIRVAESLFVESDATAGTAYNQTSSIEKVQFAYPNSLQVKKSDYVLLLNPDTEVTEHALDLLLDFADKSPNVGLVGPQLISPKGLVQSSRRRFPSLLVSLFESTWLQSYTPPGLLDHYYMRDHDDNETCDVDWVYGAAMLVRRTAYRQIGVLDERTFFMYSEEIDWCKRLKPKWQVVYYPMAQIIHHEGKSSEQVSTRRMILFNTSKVRYFKKHHGAAQAFVLRSVLLSLFYQQILLECMKWLLGHRRALRAERIQAYYQVLRSGLK